MSDYDAVASFHQRHRNGQNRARCDGRLWLKITKLTEAESRPLPRQLTLFGHSGLTGCDTLVPKHCGHRRSGRLAGMVAEIAG